MSHLTDLLRRRYVPRVLVTVLLGRLPEGMVPLGIVLLVRDGDGSFGLAGLLAAFLAVGAAVGGPPLGRLIDHRGQPIVVVGCGLVRGAALIGLTLTAPDAPVVAGFCALVCGLATPPLEPAQRALWPGLTRDEAQVETAYRLDAGLQEIVFVIGPLVLTALVAAADPALALQLVAVGGALAALAFASSPPARAWRSPPRPDPAWTAAVRAPGIPPLLAIAVLVGAVIGSLNVAAPAVAETRDIAAGWPLGIFAFGALVGGLVSASRQPVRPPEATLPWLLTGMGLALVPPLLDPPLGLTLLSLALGGALMAPSLGGAFIVVGRRALRGSAAETFAWLTSAVLTGLASGSALAGPLADGSESGTAGFLVAVAAGLLGAVVWRAAGGHATPAAAAAAPPRAP